MGTEAEYSHIDELLIRSKFGRGRYTLWKGHMIKISEKFPLNVGTLLLHPCKQEHIQLGLH